MADADPVSRLRALEERVAELEAAALEHERLRRALELSERRFRLAFETNPEAFVISRAEDGLLVDVNEGFARITGWPREETIGRTSAELRLFVEPGARERMAEEIRTRGGIDHLESQYRCKDGRIRWGVLSARGIDIEGVPHVIAVVRDIDDLRRSQAALRRSEATFKALFEHASDAISLWNMRAQMVDANPAACAVVGRTREQVLTTDPAEVVPPNERAKGAEAFAKAAAGERVLFEMTLLHPDGTTVPIENVLQRIEVDGEPMVLSVGRDISERRRLQGQLVQAQKMEAVARLASGLAHDFNNLLTVIRGCAALVGERLRGQPEAEDVEEILIAADRAAELTHQLLAFGRRQMLLPEDVSLNALVENLRRMLRRLLPESIEIVTDLRASPSTVRADPSQLEQVIVNLAVNARDAMERGGRLTLATNTKMHRSPAGGDAEPYVCLAVSDTGAGIEPALLDHIFEPFFTTKAKDKGSGLGLSTVQGIVVQSGGFVEVESEPGHGTTFRVCLRASTAAAVPLRVERATPAVELGGSERILVAEDEPSVQALICSTLRRQGYEVFTASDGKEALRLAAGGLAPCAALVTDIVMPQLGGADLARAIRDFWPGLRVLYISGYADESVLASLALGPGSAFLQKAFHPNELLRMLRRLLDEEIAESKPQP